MRAATCFGGVVAVALTSGPALAGVRDAPRFNVQPMVIVIGANDFQENGGVAPVVGDFYLLRDDSGAAGQDLISDDMVTVNINSNRANPSFNGEGSAWEWQVNDPRSFGGDFISSGPHQVLDAGDAYTAFDLDEDTDVDLLGGGGRASRFLVASNAPFDVYAEASELVTEGAFDTLGYENIRYRLRYNVRGGPAGFRWGEAAQDPAPAASGAQGVIVPTSNNRNVRWTLDNIAAGPTKVFDGSRKTAAQRGSLLEQAISFQSRYNLIGAGINGNNYDFSMGTGTLGATVTYTVYTP